MHQEENIKCLGQIEARILYKDGHEEVKTTTNTVVETGKQALARSLANDYGEMYEFFINRMLFGNGGTEAGVPKYVNVGRNGLFGTTLLSKPVSVVIDANFPSQVIFTSVVTFDEAVDDTINELALQMSTGDLYSMATFGDISKSGAMQIVFSWRVSFV